MYRINDDLLTLTFTLPIGIFSSFILSLTLIVQIDAKPSLHPYLGWNLKK
jgi:hypothetical protein